MALELVFDSTGITPNSGNPPPIPLGEYNVMIVDSSKQDTSANDGSAFLQLDLKIMDGPLAGRVQSDRMNLWNKNAKTVEIARDRLAAYAHLTGKYKITNTQEYHGIPFRAIIGPQIEKEGPTKGQPSDKYSEIKELKHTNGERPGQGKPAASSAAPAIGGAQPTLFAAPAVAGTTGAAPTFAPPVAAQPPAPVAVSQPPAPPTPPAPVAATFPPEGWAANPNGPGWFYNLADPTQQMQEAELRVKMATPPAPAATPAATQFGVQPAAGSATPPWAVQQ